MWYSYLPFVFFVQFSKFTEHLEVCSFLPRFCHVNSQAKSRSKHLERMVMEKATCGRCLMLSVFFFGLQFNQCNDGTFIGWCHGAVTSWSTYRIVLWNLRWSVLNSLFKWFLIPTHVGQILRQTPVASKME